LVDQLGLEDVQIRVVWDHAATITIRWKRGEIRALPAARRLGHVADLSARHLPSRSRGSPGPGTGALYHERWEIETALDELKTHLRGAKSVLRSKTPDLVRQEFYGLMMAHFAIRSLMHEAALKAGEDRDRLSFLHAVRIVRRKLSSFSAIPPRQRMAFHDVVLEEILQERVVSSRNRRNPRGVKRKMSNFPIRRKTNRPMPTIDSAITIQIITLL